MTRSSPPPCSGTSTLNDVAAEARAVLEAEPPSMYELGDMAARVAALEWHLGEVLALIGDPDAG